MPIDLNSEHLPNENLAEKGLNERTEKLEWHIKINEQTSTGTKQQANIKVTVISVLTAYAEKQKIGLSNADIKKAISKGALWLTPVKNPKQTQRIRRVKKPLTVGDELHFYYDKNVLATTVPNALLIKDLLDYSVWYKPFGMLSQGSKWSDHCTISRFAQQHLPNERPAFIVHRLDKAATGLILIAHSKKAARALAAMFEQHQLEKIYQIIVHGDHRQRSQPDIIEEDVDGKASRSTFTCLDYDNVNHRSLIEVQIDSGRKHQIRKHAASINMPVVGDRLHGIADDTEALDLQLCAVSLRFNCPLLSDNKNAEYKGLSLSDNMRYFELADTLKPHLSIK